MKLFDLVHYLDAELRLADFPQDHSNNGLQVEGASETGSLLFAVDAAMETFEYAAANQCKFIFVHHGLSWGGEPRRFTGMTAERLAFLFRNGISLYAAHLPLDAAPGFGNNAQLAQFIGIGRTRPFFHYDGVEIGLEGEFEEPLPVGEISARLERRLGTGGILHGTPPAQIRRAAVVSGGAGLDALIESAEKSCDLLVTGEFDHTMFHPARELGIGVLACGHYASETVGPRALMKRIADRFGAETRFADIPTGL